MHATTRLLEKNIIVRERLDEKRAQRCNCLLIQYRWQDDDDVDELVDASLELAVAVNHVAKQSVVDFLGVIFRFVDGDDGRRKRSVVEGFVSILENSQLPVVPTTFVFCVGSQKNISLNFNGNGRRWWHCVRVATEFVPPNRSSNLVRTLDRLFSSCPAHTTGAVAKLLISVALPSFFGDVEFQCLLHRTREDNDDFLPLFLTCAQTATVLIAQSPLGYDVEGNLAPIWCVLIEANASRELSAILETIHPPNTYNFDPKDSVRTVDLASLSTVAIRCLSLAQNRIVCWKGFVYVLPHDKNESSSSSTCGLENAFFEGLSSPRGYINV